MPILAEAGLPSMGIAPLYPSYDAARDDSSVSPGAVGRAVPSMGIASLCPSYELRILRSLDAATSLGCADTRIGAGAVHGGTYWIGMVSPEGTVSPGSPFMQVSSRAGTIRSTCEPMRIIPNIAPRSTVSLTA